MFYEVLMEKQANKDLEKRRKEREQSSRRVTGALGGLGAILGTGTASAGLAMGSGMRMSKNLKDDPKELEEIVKSMGGTKSGNDYILTAKDGRKITVNMDANIPNAHYDPSKRFWSKNRTGGDLRFAKKYRDHDVFFHELGHATGAGSKPRTALARAGLARGAELGFKGLGAAGALTGLGTAMYAGAASNKEQADKANRMANASLLASGLAQAPTLVEEARASIRARGLAKKFGKGLKGGRLLPAYGTYLGGAALKSSPALAAKLMAKYKQRAYRDEKTASARVLANRYKSPDNDERAAYDFGDGLTTANRLKAGIIVGSALGLAAGLPKTLGVDVLGKGTEAMNVDKKLQGYLARGAAAGVVGGGLYDHYDRKQRGVKGLGN